MAARMLLVVAIAMAALPSASSYGQDERAPTAKEISAIRSCAAKYQDDEDEAERNCLFNLVAKPCTEMPENASTQATARCYFVESAIWDDLLNKNFKELLGVLDDEQVAKLRAMQRAWVAYRDTTCDFYWDKIHGTMAIPMRAACVARETARRALLLKAFSQIM